MLIYIHKEEMLEDLQSRYPASRYVMVDDEVRILAAMKQKLGERLFTVFPHQGRYAFDAAAVARSPAPDLRVEHIADLVACDWRRVLRLPA